MAIDRSFVPVLLEMVLAGDPETSPQSCDWDADTRVATLTYDRPPGQQQTVLLHLPDDAVSEFAGGIMDKDVRDVWGPNVGTVEGAARFASIYLEETVYSRPAGPLELTLTDQGLSTVRNPRK